MSTRRPAGTLDGMNSSDVSLTLRNMWDTRPVRPRGDRKIAGVGAAIARRYDLDPVLVRVALVAAAFTGIGVPFYVLAWGLLPGEPTPGSPPDRHRFRAALLVAAGVLLLLPTAGGGEPVSFLLAAAAVVTLLVLLHRSRADRGVPGTPTRFGTTEAGPAVATPVAPGAPVPPAWDPLGAAPFAWDLPEPGPAPVPPPRPRSRVTPVTLATALLAGGVTGLVLMAAGGLTDLPVLLGVVAAVLGTGLVVGAFLRAGRGLIPFALLTVALTWGALAAPLDRIAASDAGDLRLAPLTPAALAPSYTHSAGTVELDLSRMDLSAPLGAPVSPVATRIESGAGSVEIRVPENADVRFSGSAGIGAVEFGDQESSGPDARLTVDDLGADGVASGRPLVLDVRTGAGTIEVDRG
jgi:phage shock protein PspC (stress-responsive transcriptional regulator)